MPVVDNSACVHLRTVTDKNCSTTAGWILIFIKFEYVCYEFLNTESHKSRKQDSNLKVLGMYRSVKNHEIAGAVRRVNLSVICELAISRFVILYESLCIAKLLEE